LDSRPEHIKKSPKPAEAPPDDVIDLLYQTALTQRADRNVAGGERADSEGKANTSVCLKRRQRLIRRAHQSARRPLQSEYSLWFREPEAEVIPALEELGTGRPFSSAW